MRSFDDVWREIQIKARKLKQNESPLYTLHRRTPNYIVEVSQNYIKRNSEGKRTGGAEMIPRANAKRIWEALQRKRKVGSKDVNGYYFTFALVARLVDGVSFETNPITLTLRRKDGSAKEFESIREKITRIYKTSSRAGSGSGEGPVHRKLKAMIAKNPLKTLGEKLTLVDQGIEYPFATGDRLDLLFQDDQKRYVCVEVEPHVARHEIIGFHQAGKYRILIAMAEGLDPSQVRAVVAAQTIDEETGSWFKTKYDIESKVVKG